MGGKANAAKNKERESFAEAIKIALAQKEIQDNVVASLLRAAMDGNVNAFLAIRDTIGEKPIEKAEVTTTIEGSLDDRKKEILERLRECRD